MLLKKICMYVYIWVWMIIIKYKKWIVDKKNEDKFVEIIVDDENNVDGDDKDKKVDNND